MRAVLTRQALRSSSYVQALAAQGFSISCLPVTQTVAAADLEALRGAIRAAASYDAIAFASATAVEHFVVAMNDTGATIATRTAVIAIGPATLRALQHANIAATTATFADGTGLAATVLQHVPSTKPQMRILLPRAKDGRLEVAMSLRQAGYLVDEVIAYQTAARRLQDLHADELAQVATMRSHPVDVVAFFAPSQVTAMINLVEGSANLATCSRYFAAIGATTAQALQQAGIANVAVATTPTPEALCHAIMLRVQA
jgi:uroporphyrinogen-III synthase